MDTIKELIRSKKFLALLAALIVWAVGFLGLDLDMAKVLGALGAISAYILGQGIADLGKESAKERGKIELELAKIATKKSSAKKR